MDYLERKKKKSTNKCFGSASSCKDNYGRESNFETMDGKAQCSETIGTMCFSKATAEIHPMVHCCNIPVLLPFPSHAQNLLPK